jgi:hypothetical protein
MYYYIIVLFSKSKLRVKCMKTQGGIRRENWREYKKAQGEKRAYTGRSSR